MEYIITLLKHQRDGLLGVIISASMEDQNVAFSQHPTWKIIQTGKLIADKPYPPTICDQLLFTQGTSDLLFKTTLDTWLGQADDPMNNYDRYASREETHVSLDQAYLDKFDNQG